MTLDAQSPPQVREAVEDRWFGVDRRTVKPALVVLAIGLLLIYGFQWLNAAIPWQSEIRAGDVLDLGDGATAVPPVGWQLEAGSLVGGSPAGNDALLAKGGMVVQLQVVSFTGPASAFLDQVQRAQGADPARADGSRSTLTTDAGLVGVVQTSSSPSGDELEAAFKLAGGAGEAVIAAPALLIHVRAAPDQFEQNQETGSCIALRRSDQTSTAVRQSPCITVASS